MDVILREDFPALGFLGDKVSVKRGFARNFLFPRGIALEANAESERQLRHALGSINSKKLKLRADAEKLSEELQAKTLSFTLKAGEKGKTFGSITAKDIEVELTKLGFAIDRRRIRLGEPFKKAGSYLVDIRLHSEITAQVKAEVKIELIEEKPESNEQSGNEDRRGKRGGRSRRRKEDTQEAPKAE
ncbi:MAG: 50S ribosomal protein L9 [bacterium]|nr:50S ribosomal protein L9 [bacterium]